MRFHFFLYSRLWLTSHLLRLLLCLSFLPYICHLNFFGLMVFWHFVPPNLASVIGLLTSILFDRSRCSFNVLMTSCSILQDSNDLRISARSRATRFAESVSIESLEALYVYWIANWESKPPTKPPTNQTNKQTTMGSKGFYSLSFHSATGKQGVLSWSSDNRVALACEAGVYVLVIKTSPTDFTASFVIHKECIPASQVSVVADTDVDNRIVILLI